MKIPSVVKNVVHCLQLGGWSTSKFEKEMLGQLKILSSQFVYL